MNKKMKILSILVITIVMLNTFSTVFAFTEITEHSTMSHTKTQIKEQYENAKGEEADTYLVTPVIEENRYVAGSLSDGTKRNTLKQINYFRWLAGVEPVVLHSNEYFDYCQKGAVVLAANDELAHDPSGKPKGMDDDFYNDGVAATGCGVPGVSSADISWNSSMADSIKGYIDDVDNMEPNVGHRISLLHPRAQKVAFGYAKVYGVVNVFNSYSITNSDKFMSWPSAGNFPVESIDFEARWSISLDSFNYKRNGEYVVIKANGKEYRSEGAFVKVQHSDNPYDYTEYSSDGDFQLAYHWFADNYYFALPDEVKTYLTDGGYSIKTGKTVEIELHGITDNNGEEYVIKYPVKFFSFNDKMLTGISLDEETQIALNKTRKLELKNSPEGAVPDGTVIWSSSNSDIVSVSDDGTITAKAIGNAQITATVDGYSATTNVVVSEYILGDINEDGQIDSKDATMVLKYATDKIELTETQKLAANVNNDESIDSKDATLILKYATDKIEEF